MRVTQSDLLVERHEGRDTDWSRAIHGGESLIRQHVAFKEFFGKILIWRGAIEKGHRNSDKGTSNLSIDAWNLAQAKIDSLLDQVRPRPRPGNHHRQFALAHQFFCLAVRANLRYYPGLDQTEDLRKRIDRSWRCHADVSQIIVATVPPKDKAAAAGENSPGVVGASCIPENRNHSWVLSFHRLINGFQLGKLHRRRT